MKSIEEFLSELSDLDIKIWTKADRLHVNAPKGTLIPSLQAEIAERKPEILAFLQWVKLDSAPDLPSIQP